MPVGKGFAFLMGIGSMAFGAVGIYTLVKGVVVTWGQLASLPETAMQDPIPVLWFLVLALVLPLIALYISYKISRNLSSGWKGMIVLVMLLAAIIALLSYSNLPLGL